MNIEKTLKDLASDRYINCYNLDEYKALPLEQRSRKVWWWFSPWFQLPRGVEMDLEAKFTNWDKCHAWLREQGYLQWLIRFGVPELWGAGKGYWYYPIYHKVNPIYWHLRGYIKDQHPYVRAAVPRRWTAADYLMEELLFAIVREYVELSGADLNEQMTLSEWRTEEDVTFAKECMEVYAWAKTGRATMEKQIEESYPELGDKTEGRYDELHKLEAQLKTTNDKWLAWIVAHREWLYT